MHTVTHYNTITQYSYIHYSLYSCSCPYLLYSRHAVSQRLRCSAFELLKGSCADDAFKATVLVLLFTSQPMLVAPTSQLRPACTISPCTSSPARAMRQGADLQLAYNLKMSGSQTQNVQRGIVMNFFLPFLVLTISVLIRLCKKQIDPPEDSRATRYADKDKPAQPGQQESQDHIQKDFDATAVQSTVLKQDATCIEKLLHGVHQFVYGYCPYLLLLPLNILTGTSKAFTLVLFFFVSASISLFNIFKLHQRLGDGKCLNVFFQNLWLALCFFFCVNQWAATPIAMPYVVRGT